MGFSYESGGDLSSGGKYLDTEGTFHLFITSLDEKPTKRDGSLIDNAAFRVDLEVMGGTVESGKGKITDLLFFYPKPGDKNEGAHARKLLDRFFLATAMKGESDLNEKGKKVDIELQDLVGRQFVAKFANEKDDNGKERLRLNFYDMWHVDDPAVKDIPKNDVALGMIDPALRRIGAKSPEKKPETKKAETKKSEPKKEVATAGAGRKDWSDL